MQGFDVRAELNRDGHLVLWSPRGFIVQAQSSVSAVVLLGTTPETFETSDGFFSGPVLEDLGNFHTVNNASGLGPVPGTPPPPGSVAGETYLNTDNGEVWTWDGAAWGLTTTLGLGAAAGVLSTGNVYHFDPAVPAVPLIPLAAGDAMLDGNNVIHTFEDVNGVYQWVTRIDDALFGGVQLTDGFISPYRGGFDLEGSQSGELRTPPGNMTQNAVMRSGSNVRNQNFFGVLNDISAAIRAENRSGLSASLLPKIDSFMDNLLRMLSTGGALETRYGGNISRMLLNDIAMTEAHDEIVGVDLAELSTQFMMAQNVYQATLAMMAQIVQPTLLNFLR